MKITPRFLTFMWWNLHNFAHYDASRSSDSRWPKKQADYEAKRGRIMASFQEMFADGIPDLLAVCEITREAAKDLAGRLPGDFRVNFSPTYPHDDGFQVAVVFRTGIGFTPEPPLIPTDLEDVSEGTRPMVPVHFTCAGHVIRFVACHWTAYDTDPSRLARERLADVLRRDTHAYLEPDVPKAGIARHVVVLGDLNDEPMSPLFKLRLIGTRDRESSQTGHWRDAQVRRIRLYNAAWRYLGEQRAHGADGPTAIGAAGTCYFDPLTWKTFDHLFVSGGLLGAGPPYFDEAHTKVSSTPIMLDEVGLPRPFEAGKPRGVSDHLPIVGRLVLPEVLT